ncbi:MAG TPA: class I SAM-dependent methyltransferase [Cytophagaceae bacterium]|jgi:ubiquinone/menaquinone biosynthesis C-methylase UbiE|nr:class I SAM-dependent methyltransferase [Cytophagaceae bacterium]
MVKELLYLIKRKCRHLLIPPIVRDGKAIDKVGSGNEANRNQWVIDQLSKLNAGQTLLDAGAGEQPYKKNCTHLQYVSQDFAQYNPNELKQGLQMGHWDYGMLDIVSDISAIPRSSASFDAILCTEVIEHIVNPMDAIKEFSRLLKPGGKLILTAPFCSMTHFAPYHFYSGYNRFFYETVLSREGFDIVEMSENGNYFEYVAQELKRINSIGTEYADHAPNVEVIEAQQVLLEYLAQCSFKDQGSKELLFFGMHVVAIKKDKYPL